MKKHHLRWLSGFIVLIIIAISCSSGPEKQFIGTWRAVDVQAEFDEQRSTPEMLKQVIQMEKQVFFKFLNDSILNINTLNQTNKAFWYFDDETGILSYRFTEPGSLINELGQFVDGKIIAESQTALGKLTITYSKDK